MFQTLASTEVIVDAGSQLLYFRAKVFGVSVKGIECSLGRLQTRSEIA
jgi:hypothetical protein